MEQDGAALAHTLFDAIERGDWTAVRGVCTEDAVIWQNFNRTDRPFADTLERLAALRATLRSLAYAERRYLAAADGAVLQHVLTAELADRRYVAAPFMLRLHLRDGKVVRIEEYGDPAQTAALAAAT